MYKEKRTKHGISSLVLCADELKSELPNEQLNGQVLQPQRLQKKVPVALHLSL